MGFTQSNADNSMFTKRGKWRFITLLVCVDDVLMAGDCIEFIQFTKKFLHETFKIKDLGSTKYFQGLELARSSIGINLS